MRVPLWATLLPLAIGVGGYWMVWHRFSEQFAADLARALPGQTISVGGFPYRLEAAFGSANIAAGGDAFKASFGAQNMVFNRGPWQPDLTVLRSVAAAFNMTVGSVTGARVQVQAPTAQASLRRSDGQIARLSLVFNQAVVGIGAMRQQLHANELQVHLRERITDATAPKAPRYPIRYEGVIKAMQIGLPSTSPLNLTAAFSVDGKDRLRSYAGWADGGTVEFDSVKLSDATGEILNASATMAPTRSATLLVNGSLTTVCPATVVAAFAGKPPPSELRLRTPVRLAFGGTLDALTIDAPAATVTELSRREQLPPCPALRR